MNLAVLLHFYQPYNQQDDILMRIVNECYLPLTRGLLQNPKCKLVANVNGVLLDMLNSKGYGEVISNFKQLAINGQVEFTGSAMYHAFLPLLPDYEVSRQIDLNYETNKKYFGDLYQPKGFFSPEMAISDNVINLIIQKGYKWIIAPQLSYTNGNPAFNKIYITSQHSQSVVSNETALKTPEPNLDRQTIMSQNEYLYVLFREKRISSLMLSGVCRTSQDFIDQTLDLQASDNYWVAVMDAETFGHHRIGHEDFLFDVLGNDKINSITVDGLLKTFNSSAPEYVKLRPSTWTNEEQDFWLDQNRTVSTTDKSFILWKDPENPIHKLQWELTNLIIKLVNNYEDKSKPNYLHARNLLDRAISSDQFWWASAKPWWSLEMIEQGAYELKMVVHALGLQDDSTKKAEEIYRKILDQAFEWQRTGYIRKKHLENSSTFLKKPFKERAHAEWYNQLILEFEDQINLSAKNHEFEKAIKWRDALLKLKQGSDIYDVLHVVDELWTARNIPGVKPFFSHTWEEFSDFARDNFIHVKTREEFERWQKDKHRIGGEQ